MMSRTFVIVLLATALGGLLLSFVYYYRELRRAYREDMKARGLDKGAEPTNGDVR